MAVETLSKENILFTAPCLRNKFTQLEVLISKGDPYIIAITDMLILRHC